MKCYRCGEQNPVTSETNVELAARIAELEAQLPEGMKHCTIRYLECPLGHGRLTADNWVKSSCLVCDLAAANALAEAALVTTAATCSSIAFKAERVLSNDQPAKVLECYEAIEFAAKLFEMVLEDNDNAVETGLGTSEHVEGLLNAWHSLPVVKSIRRTARLEKVLKR